MSQNKNSLRLWKKICSSNKLRKVKKKLKRRPDRQKEVVVISEEIKLEESREVKVRREYCVLCGGP